MAGYDGRGDVETYFADDEDTKLASTLYNKSDSWFDSLTTNKYLDKMKKSWNSYYGIYYDDNHSISFGGESGELSNLAVNHYRNFATHMLTMTTSNRPSFQPKSINTDLKSQVQTTLAKGLLDYYMREKRLEVHLKTAVEYAIVMGQGYIKMEWDSTSGKEYDYVDPKPMFASDDVNEETPLEDEDGNLVDREGREIKPFPIYEGDVKFSTLSPMDVVFDITKESAEDHDWVIVRSFKNKFDIAAKYPEQKEAVLRQQTKSEMEKYRLTMSSLDNTDDIPVYEFFHKRTPAMPEGRYMLYLRDEVVLDDTSMPYRRLPVYRIVPGDILGTPFGYTNLFDLMPLQDAANSLYSTILTNQNAFGVQNVLNPQGNDVKVSQISEGMNWIEYNYIAGMPNGGKPEALNLTQTPAEVFNFVGMLEKAMETISGINSVARGNPEENLRSGNALALVQSQALQFISGLQNSYIRLIEDVGTGLIQLLQDFAAVPRIAEIAGTSNRSKLKEFKGSDIDQINRVVVDVGNALSQTAAGRSEIATNLIQMGLIKSPEQYFSVLNSGNLDTMTEGYTNQLLLVKSENENLIEGKPVIAIDVDDHRLHILEHRSVLADPDLRFNDELVATVLAHITEHLDALRTVDPDLIALMGEQPLMPAGQGQPGQPGQPQAGLAGGPEALGPAPAPPGAAGVDPLSGISLPSPAEAPLDPATGLPLVSKDRPLGQ